MGGLVKDETKAVELYRQSAENGNGAGCNNMGIITTKKGKM